MLYGRPPRRSANAWGALAGAAALLVGVGCSAGYEGTVLCRATTAEVGYSPDDRVEVRVAGEPVAWAEAGGRGVDDACATVRTQTGWFVGIPYENVKKPVKLRCRFGEHFFVHLHPVYTSEGGEDFPSGSALYVVVDRRTIVVSASVISDGGPGSLSFSRAHCSRVAE